jgi:MinD-like ATPase involved in chromosome partitioning or flagellar assembly
VASSFGSSPIRGGRVVVLLSGSGKENVRTTLEGRRDLVLRDFSGIDDSRTPIESVDVVLHVTGGHAPIANEVSALREQTSAPIVLGLYGERAGVVDEAMESALSDIVMLPQPADTIAFSLRKAARERIGGQTKLSRVIMVSSTKGGTGKTSIAVNLAAQLAQTRLRTLLIDLDVQFGDVGIALGLDRPEKTLRDLTAVADVLDAEKLRGFVVRQGDLHILPAPLRPEEGENIDAARIAGVFQIARGLYDAIVVDTAPLFDGPMLTALDRSDQLLLVSTPDVPSMKNIRLALQTLDLLGFPTERIALVANRSGMAGGTSVPEMSETIGRDIRFTLPEDPIVPKSINTGIAAVLLEPRSRFSRGMKEIVTALIGTTTPVRARRLRIRGASG